MPESTPLTVAHTRHLLRRTGFGAPLAQVADFATLTRGAAADALLSFKPNGFKPGGKEISDTRDKWLKYMLKAKAPLQEKLVLFFHDHFATGYAVVLNTKYMAAQNRTLRLNCKGNFKSLVKQINLDPAMMEYLDTTDNSKAQPNENYSRELQELFTLGVQDFAGNANYSQADIYQIARAFTGWRHDGKNALLNEGRHDFTDDYPERGPKVIYKTTGGFGNPAGQSFTVGGEGENEIDEVIEIIFQHTDTDGENTVARRTARRLIEYFAYPILDPISATDKQFVDDVVGFSGFATTWDLSALLKQIFVHDRFYLSAVPVGSGYAASDKKSVKWPIDYVVGTLRLLDMKLKGSDQCVQLNKEFGICPSVQVHVGNMGQALFDPPSVFGWNWETGWIGSQTLLARYEFARDLTSARVKGKNGFHPDLLIARADPSLEGNTSASPTAVLDAATTVLGITDQLTPSDLAALEDYLTDNGSVSTLDLTDSEFVSTKLHGVFAVLLQSPAYQVH